jgi:hypothetical protein
MKVTRLYKGTPDQAMALAERTMRDWHEAKVEAQNYKTLQSAVDNLQELVDSLAYTLRYPSESNLLDAVFEFSTIEQALEIVRIKVDQARERIANDEDIDDEENDDEFA